MAGNFMTLSPYLSGQSLGSSFNSSSFSVGEFDRFAVKFKITGAAGLSGTLKLQCSVDDVDYVDVPDTSISVTGNNSYLISVTSFIFKYIRISYTSTAGTGSLEVKVNSVNEAK